MNTNFTERQKCSRYDKNQCSQLVKLGVHAWQNSVFTVGKNTQAIDEHGARSSLSDPIELKTGDSEPALRDGIHLVDLEEIGAIFKKPSANTLIVTNPSQLSQDISLKDVLISYYDEDPFIGKVLGISRSGEYQNIEIEPMLLHETLSSGSFQMDVKSHGSQDSNNTE